MRIHIELLMSIFLTDSNKFEPFPVWQSVKLCVFIPEEKQVKHNISVTYKDEKDAPLRECLDQITHLIYIPSLLSPLSIESIFVLYTLSSTRQSYFFTFTFVPPSVYHM